MDSFVASLGYTDSGSHFSHAKAPPAPVISSPPVVRPQAQKPRTAAPAPVGRKDSAEGTGATEEVRYTLLWFLSLLLMRVVSCTGRADQETFC
jgi:hypothetical protein